ncbi:hypothetical protein D9M70_552430 [compost metagenome]
MIAWFSLASSPTRSASADLALSDSLNLTAILWHSVLIDSSLFSVSLSFLEILSAVCSVSISLVAICGLSSSSMSIRMNISLFWGEKGISICGSWLSA